MSTLVWFVGSGLAVAALCWATDRHDLEQLDRLFNKHPADGVPPVAPFAGPPSLTSVPCDPCPWRPKPDDPADALFALPDTQPGVDRG